jgi:hypothetical protein
MHTQEEYMTSSKQQLVRVSLFRGTDHARAAIKDLMCVGVPPELIRMIGGSGNSDTTIGGIKKALGIAERDARSLTDCVERGGIVVAVSSHAAFSDGLEAIFMRCQAAQDGVTATCQHDLTTKLPKLWWC